MRKLLLLLLFLISSIAEGAMPVNPSYVSPTGSGSTCTSVSPCALSYANTNATAGNTVYLKEGTYNVTTTFAEPLKPANSGTSGSKITFAKDPAGGTAELVCSGNCLSMGYALVVENKSYIIIDGIKFTNFPYNALIRINAHHIEVKNCIFQSGGVFYINEDCNQDPANTTCYVSHLWIHDNQFLGLSHGGGCSAGKINEGGDVVRVGYPCGTAGGTQALNHHITIENNILNGGHATMDTYGTEIVIKNNVSYNYPWYPENNGDCLLNFPANGYSNASFNGYYGHRNIQITDDFGRDYTHNLVEGNRLGHAGVNPNNDGANNLDIAAPKNIVRYNTLYDSMESNAMFKYSTVGVCGQGINGGTNNRFYNNTIYHSGYGYPSWEAKMYDSNGTEINTTPEELQGIRFWRTETTGNIVKNNIVYDSRRYTLGGVDIQAHAGNTITNNWVTSDGDPQFRNTTLTNLTSTKLPDLSVKSTSPVINGGTYLTQTNGASATPSTTLIVDDALYFQDGTWGSDLARGVTFFADWIAVGTVSNTVQISSINYSTNTIELKTAITWADNAPVWLYKNSSGTRVLYSSAPDYGAHEYNGTVSIGVGGTATTGTGGTITW